MAVNFLRSLWSDSGLNTSKQNAGSPPSEPELSGQQLGGRYKVVRKLGAGGFGQTFLAHDLHLPGQPLCVIKQLKPQITSEQDWQIAQRLFDTEAQVLYQLGSHPQIPRLLAHFEQQHEFYLAQEYIEGHSLHDEFQSRHPIPEADVVAFLGDVLSTLAFVHDHRVIHRDLKPANLIRRRQDDRIVLIDFGAVKQVGTQLMQVDHHSAPHTISIGTRGYMPNEQLAGIPHYSSDIYAVGMMAIQLLSAKHPSQLPLDPRTTEVSWHHAVPDVQPELQTVLDRMIRYDFKSRYSTAAEALAALRTLPESLLDSLSTAVQVAGFNARSESGPTPQAELTSESQSEPSAQVEKLTAKVTEPQNITDQQVVGPEAVNVPELDETPLDPAVAQAQSVFRTDAPTFGQDISARTEPTSEGPQAATSALPVNPPATPDVTAALPGSGPTLGQKPALTNPQTSPQVSVQGDPGYAQVNQHTEAMPPADATAPLATPKSAAPRSLPPTAPTVPVQGRFAPSAMPGASSTSQSANKTDLIQPSPRQAREQARVSAQPQRLARPIANPSVSQSPSPPATFGRRQLSLAGGAIAAVLVLGTITWRAVSSDQVAQPPAPAESSVAVNPDTVSETEPTAELVFVTTLEAAEALRAEQQFEQALAKYDEAIALNNDVEGDVPELPDAYAGRCYSLNRMQQFEEALAACDRALALDPNHPRALGSKGYAFHLQGQLGEAIPFYDRAIAADDSFAEAWNNKGTALLQMDDPQAAIQSFDAALDRDPELAEAWNNRSAALWSLREFDQAISSVERALQLDPDYEDARSLRQQMRDQIGR
ncbi:MAG: tetratricopeptide repeat protein [Cyanobacteria bacterium P01_H01_bin.121]